jgi:uncharacterized membrane protein YidH (DUF202 family)
MTAYDPEARDPGLAAERTDLAWSRSGLSLLACGAFILRGVNRPPLTSANVATGICVLMLGAFISFLGAWHGHNARRRSGRQTNEADLLPIASGVVADGIAALLVAAFS